MQMEITYIALDGTRFDDEDLCRDYEDNLLGEIFGKEALFFTSTGERLPFTEDGFLSADFILCKTKEAAEYLQKEYGRNYYTPWDSFPTDAGCWIHEEDSWRPVDDYIDELEDKLLNARRILKYGVVKK